MNESLICATPDLEAACAVAEKEGLVALDTEFVSTCTYLPRLGLVQMGCRSGCCALEMMCGMYLDPLAALVGNASVVKILHDAHQDLVLISRRCGAAPRNVFDTQLAAAFAGFPSAMSLQKLLFDAIGVGLPKTQTLTDWTRRPLSDAQLAYALDDVRHLPDLRDDLLARASDLGTLSWLEEEIAGREADGICIESDPDEAWKRVKTGRIRLDGRGRAVLRALAACREVSAKEWNLPRGWLGDDASLALMAQEGDVSRLRHRLPGRGETMRARYAEAIATAEDLPEEEWPEDPHRHYISEVVEASGLAMDWLAERAEEVHVDARVIASKAVVTAYVDNVDDMSNPLSSGWRYEVAGREIAERFGVD